MLFADQQPRVQRPECGCHDALRAVAQRHLGRCRPALPLLIHFLPWRPDTMFTTITALLGPFAAPGQAASSPQDGACAPGTPFPVHVQAGGLKSGGGLVLLINAHSSPALRCQSRSFRLNYETLYQRELAEGDKEIVIDPTGAIRSPKHGSLSPCPHQARGWLSRRTLYQPWLALQDNQIFTALGKWSGRQDSNLRPSGPKPDALPDCATPRRAAALRLSRRRIQGQAGPIGNHRFQRSMRQPRGAGGPGRTRTRNLAVMSGQL